MDATEIYCWLIAFFSARYETQADKSLIDAYAGHREVVQPDTHQLAALFSRRKWVLAWAAKPAHREALAAHLADLTLAFTVRGKPLLAPSGAVARRFRHVYAQALQETLHLLETADAQNWEPAYRMLIKCHWVRLRALLTSLLPPSGPGRAGGVREMTASEYAPDWQLQVLDVNLAALSAPVLDVGCGKSGHLVAKLRAAGLDACGLDLQAEALPGLIRSDWLNFRFDPGLWGTIVAHLSFSSYFWFEHLSAQGQPKKYVKKYLDMANGLAPGGRLAYFPALPFMEKSLPADRFEVRKIPLALAADLRDQADIPPLYAVHVLARDEGGRRRASARKPGSNT